MADDPALQYFYLPLEDAKKSVNMRVNLFAAVAEVGSAKKSKGTDYILTIKMVDQSDPAGLSVNFFAENTSKLPHVRSTGDIISLHRVVMRIYDGEHYCVYSKSFSSFALFEGRNAVGVDAYQTSMKHCATNHDDKFLSQLRIWLLDHQPDTGLNEKSLLLRSIKIGQNFDLVCKVLHVCETGEGDWVFFVWDGTDAPPVSSQINLDNEEESLCPLHPEVLPLSREVLREFPHVGTILRIISGKFFKEIQHLQGGGHWVRLCNINCELQSGMWKGVLQPSSNIHFLSDEDASVLHRERRYIDRIASEVERQPLTSFPNPSAITMTDYEHVAYSTLMDSLTHPEVTHKCKCVVRVVAAYPWRAEDLRSPSGHYRIRLTLEDPTARIHAYIYKEDGVYFFGGYPTLDVLSSKMKKLLGITDAVGGGAAKPEWVWCCLKSYYLDKSDPWESRRYRIFGTRLLA